MKLEDWTEIFMGLNDNWTEGGVTSATRGRDTGGEMALNKERWAKGRVRKAGKEEEGK